MKKCVCGKTITKYNVSSFKGFCCKRVYNYFKKLLKTNESISWLRLDKNDKVYRVAKKYKREFHK